MPRAAAGRLVVAACLALLAGGPAVASPPWLERYERGLALEAQGAWPDALREFGAAARADPFPRRWTPPDGRAGAIDYDPHYHMALCLTEMGRPKMAAAQLKLAFQAKVTPEEKLGALRERIRALPPHRAEGTPPAGVVTGQLRVESDPPGAQVFVDGNAIGTTPLGPVALASGERAVRVEAAGFRPVEEDVALTAGATETLVVPLLPLPTPTPRARPTAAGARAAAPAAAPTVPPKPTAAATAAPTAVPTTVPTAAEARPAATAPALEAAASPAGPQVAPSRRSTLRSGLAIAAVALAVLAFGAGAWRARRRGRGAEPRTGPTLAYEHAPTRSDGIARIGEYEVEGVLGRGGMATTYRARRGGDRREVALKVPHEGCLADETFVARFVREGQLGEQLHHPRIVRIHDAGEANGRPFLAMELIAGTTLKQALRASGPLRVRRAVEIARDVAEALDYAHAKGVVHRDLKPENVMLLPDGSLKVMDFGIARLADQPGLTSSNLFLGTPQYAAPEMVDPKRIDHRVDLYALGIILFEMLEGAVPFAADSPYRVLEMHLQEPLPPRERLAHPVPEPVWAVLLRLCEKDPAARYPSAQALLVELNRLLHRFSGLEGSTPA